MNGYIIIILIVVLGIVYIYWNPLKIHNLIFGTQKTIYKLNEYNPSSSIGITIDDVPYRDYTILKSILDTFKNTTHKLTFFVISSFINDSNRHLLIRAVREGHMLANHGITDRCHYKLNNVELEKKIFECQKVLEDIYMEANVEMYDNIYYRPGCGFVNSHMKYLEQDGVLRIVLGSVYSNDPHIPIDRINTWYIKNQLVNMDIIILHDRPWTLKTLTNLKSFINANKLRSISIK